MRASICGMPASPALGWSAVASSDHEPFMTASWN
jgi:hypothetical protein